MFFLWLYFYYSVSQKNILRVKNTNNIFLGIQKIENLYKLRDDISNEYAKIYYPDIDNNKKMDGKEDYVGIRHLFALIKN